MLADLSPGCLYRSDTLDEFLALQRLEAPSHLTLCDVRPADIREERSLHVFLKNRGVWEVRQTPHVHMVYVRLLMVPPIALGAWSMALVLWQPPEYYETVYRHFRIEDPKLLKH